MVSEKVIVARSGRHDADLLLRRQAHCRGCSANTGCGHYLLDNLRDKAGLRRNNTLTLPLPVYLVGNVHAGDTLILAMQEARLMQLAILLYGLPLLAMLVGTFSGGLLAKAFGGGDSWSILGAVLGLMGGLVRTRRMALPVPAQLFAQPEKTADAAPAVLSCGENREFNEFN